MPKDPKKEEQAAEPQNIKGDTAAAATGGNVPPPAGPVQQFVQIPIEEYRELKQKLDTVYQATDRGRLASVEGRNPKKLPTVVKLSTLDAGNGARKVVMAWRVVKDEVFKAPNGAWVENQIVEVLFEDNSKLELPLIDFYRKTAIDRITARVVSRQRDEETGAETFVLACEDGKERTIAGTFVN